MEMNLEDLRLKTLVVVLNKLNRMLDEHADGKFFKKCSIQHVTEMVKLYHQAKSLEK